MTVYEKHYIPLESDPEVFTDLAHELGLSKELAFQDVLSLDDPDLMAMVPRPVLALILIFPTSEAYEARKSLEESLIAPYEGLGEGENVTWFKQTINNACGLYAILHAVSNGSTRNFIGKGSPLESLLRQCIPLRPDKRAKALELSEELENAYKKAALQGQSRIPEDVAAEVDYHYVCFLKSKDVLYELDGDKKGPVNRGALSPQDDVLSDKGLSIIQEFIQIEGGQNPNFSLMALVPNQ